MAVNGKAKGNTYERKIANLLSDTFKDKTGIDKAFRRNADSGSYFGGKNFVRTSTHDTDKASFGDIIAPKDFKFNIECKHYKTPPSFSMIVKQDCKMLDGWIKQAETDSASSGLDFVIIMKFNNVDDVVVTKNHYDGMQSFATYKGYYLGRLDRFLTLDIFWN